MTLQRMGSIGAISASLIYLTMFVGFGVFLPSMQGLAPAQKIEFLIQHQVLLHALYSLGYLVFGVLLVPLVLAMRERLKADAKHLSDAALLFGVLWAGLVLASGMIFNAGLIQVLKQAQSDTSTALQLWLTVRTFIDALGGGNEIVGALWTFLLSMAMLKSNNPPRALTWLGILVAVFGISTVYPSEISTSLFGISQLLWFAWLGIWLGRTSSERAYI